MADSLQKPFIFRDPNLSQNLQGVTEADVLITERLKSRSSRQPDFAAENEALRALARSLKETPQSQLKTLVRMTLDLCRSHSVGISRLETTPEGESVFRWVAIAGVLEPLEQTTTPSHFSPCGTTLASDRPQLYSYPDRYFTYLQAIDTTLVEELVFPLMTDSQALGTIWMVLHDDRRHFDGEDVRLLTSLADFTTATLLQQPCPMGELLAAQKAIQVKDELAQWATDKYRTLFSSIDEGYFLAKVIFDENDRPIDIYYVEANPAAIGIVGRNFAGKRLTEVDPNYEAYWYEIPGRVAQTGKSERVERYAEPDSKWYDLFIVKVGDEKSRQVAVLFNDITVRKRREANVAFLAEMGEECSRFSTADEIMQGVGARIGAYLQIKACHFADVDEARGEVTVHRGWNSPEILSPVGTFPIDRSFSQECKRASRAGETVMIRNTQTDPRADGPGYAALNIHALVIVPFHRNGQWAHCIAVCDSQPREWRDDEIELIEEFSNRIFPRIERIRTEVALRQSEQHFRLMADVVPQIIWLMEADGQMEFFNKQWSDYTGVSYQQTTATEFAKHFVHPEDRDRTLEVFNEARCRGVVFSLEHRILSATGTYRWFLVRAEPYRDRLTGEIVRWFGASVDIHDRKRLEANLGFLAEIMADFSPVKTADEIMRIACVKTVSYFNLSRCLLVKISDAMDVAEVVYDFGADDLPSLVGTYPIANFHTEYEIQDLAAGRAIVVNDVTDAPRTIEAADRFSQLRIGALVNASYVSDGQWKFVLSAMQVKPRVWCTDEIELLQELSARVCLRIERARAEVALHESEAKYRSLFESMDEGFCILQLMFDEAQQPIDYCYLEINPAFEQQTGLKNARGQTIRNLVPTIEPFWLKAYGKVALTGKPTRFVDYVKSMGRWFNINVFRLGEPHEYKVAVLFNDISDRKRAEAELEQLLANERHYTKQLQGLATATLAINSVLSVEEILKVITQQAASIIGAHQSVTSMTLDANWTQAIKAVHLSDKYAQWRDDSQSGEGWGIDAGACYLNRPMRMTQAQLEVHPCWHRLTQESDRHPPTRGWLVAPLMGRDGHNIGLLHLSDKYEGEFTPSDESILVQLAQMASVAIENARLYKAEQQARAVAEVAREEAQAANRVKDEFLAVLSHELRSPLNPILGWSRLLQSGKLDEAKTIQALAAIERNAKLQSELIEDLLDVSRILRGKLSLDVVPVNLAATIRAAMETIQLAAEAKSIQVEAKLVSNAFVLGDATRLQQVIWNLLSNAVKFTPVGGKVNIRLETLDSWVEITVIDTGQGIPSDFLPYVFDYFRQANATTTRKFGGLGLGLAIVRHLVELHGGIVRADSPGEGQGARFIVRLPLRSVALSVNPDERSSEPPIDLQGIEVLVVDDEIDTREWLVFLLEQQGAKVMAAATASEALQILTQNDLDILLSDIGMPDMDGYMLIRQVRALAPEQGGQIPAIALTAYAGDMNQQYAIEAGFQKHIAKPIEPGLLMQTIASFVRPT